ncbi:MAG: aspartyl protease family protein [Planctomycetota bacterium]
MLKTLALLAATAALTDAQTSNLRGWIESTAGETSYTLTLEEAGEDALLRLDGVAPTAYTAIDGELFETDEHGVVRRLVLSEAEIFRALIDTLTRAATPDGGERPPRRRTVGSEGSGAIFERVVSESGEDAIRVSFESGDAVVFGPPVPAEPAVPAEDTIAMPEHDRSRVSWGSAPESVRVSRARRNHALVDVSINGRDLGKWVFDTGAAGTVIDESAARRLGLEPYGNLSVGGVGGFVEAPLYLAESITLGPATLDRPRLIGADLSSLSASFGTELVGIVGFDIIAHALVEIEVGGDRIRVAPPDSAPPENVRWVDAVWAHRIACVRAAVEGTEGWYRLDTGAAADTVSFHAPAVERLALLDRATERDRAGGIGGFVPTRSGRVRRFELAGERWADMPAEFAIEPVGAFADGDTDGNIGGRVLGRFERIVFDFAAGRVGFVPER